MASVEPTKLKVRVEQPFHMKNTESCLEFTMRAEDTAETVLMKVSKTLNIPSSLLWFTVDAKAISNSDTVKSLLPSGIITVLPVQCIVLFV